MRQNIVLAIAVFLDEREPAIVDCATDDLHIKDSFNIKRWKTLYPESQIMIRNHEVIIEKDLLIP